MVQLSSILGLILLDYIAVRRREEHHDDNAEIPRTMFYPPDIQLSNDIMALGILAHLTYFFILIQLSSTS